MLPASSSPVCLRLGQAQQGVRQLTQVDGVLPGILERTARRLSDEATSQQHVELHPQCRDRRAQVVRCPSDEGPLMLDAVLDAGEQPVECRSESADFVVLRDVRQSSSQVMEADGIRLARQVADRRQGTTSEPPPADQRSEGAQDPDHDQQLGEAGGAAVDSSQ